MDSKKFLNEIHELIAHDELAAALQRLRGLLDNSPKLDEVLLQSARFQDIRKQIRLGTVSSDDANLTKSQIRAGLLDLLQEIESSLGFGEGMTSSHTLTPALREEMECAISIVKKNSINSTKRAETWNGIDFIPKHQPPLRPFVPLLAGVFLGSNQQMQEPLSLTVAVDNRTPNPEFLSGRCRNPGDGDKSETKPIREEADFKGMPPKFRDSKIRLTFEPRFFKINGIYLSTPNTSYPPRQQSPVFGTVKDAQQPLAGVQTRGFRPHRGWRRFSLHLLQSRLKQRRPFCPAMFLGTITARSWKTKQPSFYSRKTTAAVAAGAEQRRLKPQECQAK